MRGQQITVSCVCDTCGLFPVVLEVDEDSYLLDLGIENVADIPSGHIPGTLCKACADAGSKAALEEVNSALMN